MDTQSQLDKHEAECAIRYTAVQEKLTTLDKRLWRLEAMTMMSTIAVVSAVVALITQVT
tara:strand:- start:135 stop:311 length:177 start_codon:yes stop_codon:yes gene_type:complete